MGKDGTEMGKKDALQQEETERGGKTNPGERGRKTNPEERDRKTNSEVKKEEAGGERKLQYSGKRYPDIKDEAPTVLRESDAAPDYYEDPYGLGKRQGTYTVDDYFTLPEDLRAELIDGWIYNMSAPRSAHGIVGYRISRAFDSYIETKHGKCIALDAAMNVQVDRTKWTMVQPDVLILCDPDKLKENKILGPPDLAVEILSPSTAIIDKTIKLKKYRESGVREYWIVDLDSREVFVYRFPDTGFDALPRRYTFRDKVPVGIFQGECEVDFAEIERYLKRFGLA
ncbi:MAG: Uma2 family endonuclease [Lachnospiraceae bacterium]|nr:Uma2 family endonuclease [Lachnospiraceae bacterium]